MAGAGNESSGVERELHHAFEGGKEVYVDWACKGIPSPLITASNAKGRLPGGGPSCIWGLKERRRLAAEVAHSGIELADLVSEIQPIKHPLQQGIKAQRGIEF